MASSDLEAALRLIRASKVADFVGPQDEAAVAAAETALELEFPLTYGRFVRELGAGAYGSLEFFGIVHGSSEPSALDAVRCTLDQRRTYGLPAELVVVGLTGMGEFYVLDLSQLDAHGEAPVVVVPMPTRDDPIAYREHVSADFGVYLHEAVRNWNEDHPKEWQRGWPGPNDEA
jgi:hypothetical protein